MGRLNKKLQDSLMSEIFILRRINHPNIIRLLDMIENLLLSTDENDADLKIADFGFARSSQPRGLAETLFGSPLYMAPEIMQLHKYDAKALDSQNSAPSTSHGSLDLGDAFEQPSTNSLTRISSLKKCAATIAELVHERIKSDKHLEAFSIQLAILAIWKQALHICHTQAISGLEGSPTQDINKLRGSSCRKHERITDVSHDGLEEISSQIQRQFIRETEVSEELSKEKLFCSVFVVVKILINLAVGNTMMPDAMETLFEAALDLGKLGGVKEVMGDIENAGNQYSKAVRLLVFLLVEAPMLILNPPLSLTNSDRYRSEHISIS
ncbi:hypothetical protein ARALYDRAFT_356474 [Arabidopsis lyrata subsp. lyrata]|uniref:Protein kinase domain-containing protein n=1 Tax=Arabidopsis lyrata subsp. lyrata TaxID=81972 RepID=D7MU30_ARALL|nr:hypothetical protein ARALYDRAFT_356474 [Arabidopsis lyrata subsp. lyrata]